MSSGAWARLISARVASSAEEDGMNQNTQTRNDDDMLPEYDFSNAVRGNYYDRYRQSTNVVVLDPDIADVFPNAAAVNEALRALVKVADAKASRRPSGTGRPGRVLQSTARASRRPKSRKGARAARG